MNLRIATLLAATCLTSANAYAEEFYVELGRTGSESDAKAMWDDIKAQHAFLNDYDVFPNQILQSDGTFTYRVQAGPMIEKSEAQKVCNRLFRNKVSCFVIEGFDPKNTQTFATPQAQAKVQAMVQKQDFVLPWLQTEAAAAPAPVVPAPEAPLIAATGSEAKVDVAEAIPVPVSEDDSQVTVAAPLEIAGVSDAAPSVVLQPQIIQQTGWVSVQPFLDDARARDYWQKIKGRVPREQRGLNMRIIHPVVSGDIPRVVLALGTFDSEQAASGFCRDYVPSSTYLECSFSNQPPDGQDASSEPSAPVPVSARNVAGDEYSLYWVEVFNETSQDKALEKWERVRTDNDDLLSDVRSQIITSLATPGNYTVKIGPLKSKTKAGALCDTLKARKIACKLSTL